MHDHGNCERCDVIEADFATTMARAEQAEAALATILEEVDQLRRRSTWCGQAAATGS